MVRWNKLINYIDIYQATLKLVGWSAPEGAVTFRGPTTSREGGLRRSIEEIWAEPAS